MHSPLYFLRDLESFCEAVIKCLMGFTYLQTLRNCVNKGIKGRKCEDIGRACDTFSTFSFYLRLFFFFFLLPIDGASYFVSISRQYMYIAYFGYDPSSTHFLLTHYRSVSLFFDQPLALLSEGLESAFFLFSRKFFRYLSEILHL